MKSAKLNLLLLFVLFTLMVSCDKPEPIQIFTLSTLPSPAEGGKINVSPPSGTYNEGQTVTLTPEANPNWVFQQWEGDASGTSNPLNIVMASSKSITGVFIKKDYPLNITIEGEGTVTEVIVTNPSGREYPHGTIVELTPIPSEQWVFEAWEGDLSGNEIPQRITVDGQKNVTARFGPKIDSVEAGVFYLAENGITCKCEDVKRGNLGFIDGIAYEAVDNFLLRQRRDQDADLTKLCTSLVTDMSLLFNNRNFNQPIGNWDVSNVENMSAMFSSSWPNINPFNQEIGYWDVGNVIEMSGMFSNSNFNQPIGNWDVSNVTVMSEMFGTNNADHSSPFNHDIASWDVSKVTSMSGMFYGAMFNLPIAEWDISNVKTMAAMFGSRSHFNQPIENWDVSNVTDMSQMFEENKFFNQPIGNWDVSNVTNMGGMFFGSTFNQPIGDWDVSKVTDMFGMFGAYDDEIPEIQFNQPIGDWDVSEVTEMGSMFWHNQHFNQNLSKWCVTKITSMPENFSTGATAWVLPKPVWGTCPD